VKSAVVVHVFPKNPAFSTRFLHLHCVLTATKDHWGLCQPQGDKKSPKSSCHYTTVSLFFGSRNTVGSAVCQD